MNRMIRTLLCLLTGGHDYYPPHTRNWRARSICKRCAHVKVREIR